MVDVTLDNKLNFGIHLLNITKNANKKSNALTRVQKYVNTNQKKLSSFPLNQKKFSSFIKSQFTYCPLIWMFCTKRSLRRINNIHERCLRLIQQNYRSEFERLLENANEKSVHQKCIGFLLIEVYKYLNGLSPDRTLSLSSDKIPMTSKISTHLNLKILEQRN